MGWGNIFKRRVKFFALALVINLDYKVLQEIEKWMSESKKNELWEKAHVRNARRVLSFIVRMEGLWVKLGQFLSTRADVLPQAYIHLLKQLQDSLPPRPVQEIWQTIGRELGKSIVDLFLNFDEVPLATASIAQVHRATLSNGQEVVVKVQHEDIKEIILEDLENVKSVVQWIAWAEPQYDFNPTIEEWCKEAPMELDFNLEADNTRRVSSNLGCTSNCSGDLDMHRVNILIPKVLLSTQKVLVLEYMDGVQLNDSESLEALGVDIKKLLEEITRAYAHQIFIDGFFHGDPHPGNFLVSKDPSHQPILLDFGLTKALSPSLKQALAKMFIASAEGDHGALLSSLEEMGLKLRLDIPEQVMEMVNVFFRASTPSNEALQNMKLLAEHMTKSLKILHGTETKRNEKQTKRLNPVDSIPGDFITFSRVINLLRGLSSSMNVRVVFSDIMRPFAESVLQCNLNHGPKCNANWINDSPVCSNVEAKLRNLLLEMGSTDKVLGIQVCAYKDGEVIIETAAGVLGKYDPRPVQHDSLFPVFSVSKGITAGMLHWLVDKGKVKLEEKVANIWPEFGFSGKDQIKVHHVLNHTSGLQNALMSDILKNPLLMVDWEECLKLITKAVPETEPGNDQLYHYLSFGWLCGGIIERASGEKFQEILEEAFVRPLNIDGELYIGIPPGVESRLASLTVDEDEIMKVSVICESMDIVSRFGSKFQQIHDLASTIPALFNTLFARRAIVPAANAHCSARALARYYAALVDEGVIPPPHGSSANSQAGSHSPVPEMSPSDKIKPSITNDTSYDDKEPKTGKLFSNSRIHDAFMGVRDYNKMAVPGGRLGLGFSRLYANDGKLIGFGHMGVGGSVGYCDINNRFSIAVTLNKMSTGGVTEKIIDLVSSELNIPLPIDLFKFA